MNIRDLEYLVALSEHQHFRKAAAACFVSQPTLSGQIRKLEDDLGVLLLERSSRKVFFTDAGMSLVHQAKKVLSEVKLLEEMANKQNDDMSGVINLGVIPTVAPYLLPSILPKLKQSFPALDLHIHEMQTDQLIAQLESGKLDCVVWASIKETQPFKELPLYTEPFLLALPSSHPWADLSKVNMSALQNQSLLMLSDGHCLREQTQDYCFSVGAVEDERFRASSLETLRGMVSAKMGITLVPQMSVPKGMPRDDMAYVKVINPEPHRFIALGFRPSSLLKNRYEKLAQEIKKMMLEAKNLL